MVCSEINQTSEARSPSEDIIDYSVSNTGLTWTTEDKAFKKFSPSFTLRAYSVSIEHYHPIIFLNIFVISVHHETGREASISNHIPPLESSACESFTT
jgi:hypothetical protein